MGERNKGKQFKPRINRLNEDRYFDDNVNRTRTELTYDEYIESIGVDEKIIDISDETTKDVLSKNVKKAFSTAKHRIVLIAKHGSPRFLKIKAAVGLFSFSTKKMVVIGSASLGVAILLVVSVNVFRSISGNNNSDGVVGSAVTGSPTKSILPSQEVLVESTTSDSADPGKDPKTEFSLYDNQIQDYTITVSKQVIPADNNENPEGFLDIAAASFDASASFTTSKGKAYVANIGQEEDQSQVAFFVDNGSVIFLRTQSIRLNIEAWAEYINKF